MQHSQSFAVPNWLSRYNAADGRGFATIDDGTLQYLSSNFGVLPVLLLPVDYTLPQPAGLCMAVPPVPLPLYSRAAAGDAPALAEPTVTLEELEDVLGGDMAAATAEGELAELSDWFRSLTPAAKQQALATVSKQLTFTAEPAPVAPPQPQRLPIPSPSLTVYADSALTSPAAAPAPAMVAARPATLAPLGDRTNLQAPAATKQMKQLSSKLHVAHSQKVAPQLPAEDIKQLLEYQLANAARSEATRAPWFREGSQAARRKPAVLQAQAQQGTGVWVPQAARGLRG